MYYNTEVKNATEQLLPYDVVIVIGESVYRRSIMYSFFFLILCISYSNLLYEDLRSCIVNRAHLPHLNDMQQKTLLGTFLFVIIGLMVFVYFTMHVNYAVYYM